jgi:hypothetical protein
MFPVGCRFLWRSQRYGTPALADQSTETRVDIQHHSRYNVSEGAIGLPPTERRPDVKTAGQYATRTTAVIRTQEGKPVYGAAHAGCWFDNCRGFYLGEAVIAEAIAHGFAIDEETQSQIDAAERYADLEFSMELWDEASDFMGQFAAEGYWFGISDWGGDWGLWECEED